MTNDSDYDDTSTNFTGVPAFRDNFRISHNSTGASMGTRGKNVGLVDPTIIELGPVVINEIMYKASSDYDSGDWVELYNPHDDTINVSFWNLRDENDSHNYIIPENTSLPPAVSWVFAGTKMNSDQFIAISLIYLAILLLDLALVIR